MERKGCVLLETWNSSRLWTGKDQRDGRTVKRSVADPETHG